MFNAYTPFHQPLDNSLVLHSIRDIADAERLAAFNASSFGTDVGTMSRALILQHPAARPDYWLYIEDTSSGAIVSSLCLIPWTWRCEEVRLRSAEMGIVSTHPDYRNRGLIRALDQRFKALLARDEFDLSHIQGIPYFYRQFDYEYAIPLELHWELELRRLPDGNPDQPLRTRRADRADIPALMDLYADATRHLDITTVRSAAGWQYVLENSVGTATEIEVWLILDEANEATGYCSLPKQGFGDGLIVSETARLSAATADGLFGWLKHIAAERGKPYVRLNLPATSDLVQAGRPYGAALRDDYAWQIHVPDAARLLRKLTPVLERRLAASLFADLTETLPINLYRDTVELQFERGKLISVQSIGASDTWGFRLPPLLLAPLVLGYRSRAELRSMYPDVGIWGRNQQLADVLFPKLNSFIFTNY